MRTKTREEIIKNMRSNKGKGTSIELLLGKAMWQSGIRYRKNTKDVFGKPDFTIKKYKLAIFVDGEFWHGKDWEQRKHDHKSNIEFWINKIEGNMRRDELVNTTLKEQGWTVLRFWEKDVKKNPESCILHIESTINEIKSRQGES